MVEPFMLYVSKRFLDRASKVFGLGFIVRKPLVEILRKLNIPLKELERDEAQEIINRIAESKGLDITVSELLKNITLALFLPTGILIATLKKVHYRAGIDTDYGVILELLAEIPRAFKSTLFYDIWIVIPKTAEGEVKIKQTIKSIVEKTGVPPLTQEEWEGVQPIVEKLRGKLELKGLTEDLWKSL